MQEALRSSDKELREAQRLSHVGNWELELETGEVVWSEELYRIAGLDPELPAPNYREQGRIYTPQSWNMAVAGVNKILQTKEPYELDLEMIRPDGTIRRVIARVEAEHEEDGSLLRLRGTVQDVTEHKRLEEQLVQAQKMEGIGQLAGGVAHDFNNLLGVIIGHSEILEQSLTHHENLAQHVEGIHNAANRAAALTRQLLAFSRKQVMQPKVINLNDVVENLGQMLRRLIGENIELVIDLAPTLNMVNADRIQIEQVLMNLAVNARDAMPKGGQLKIATANVQLDGKYILDHPPVIPGDYVMFSVADTGTGMDQHVASRLFEPFFTTKEFGKGTGLGLSIAYGIVKQSQGHIWAYSETGQGSTFKVYLPQIQGTQDQGLPPSEPASDGSIGMTLQEAPETLLLVEDEDVLREMVIQMLKPTGYKILAAATAQEALSLSESHKGRIVLLLTDVMLRGSASGQELARQLKLVRPETKVLFMSGYSELMITEAADSGEPTTLLQKPFSTQALLRKIREALASAS